MQNNRYQADFSSQPRMLLNQFNCVTEQATVNKRQDKAFFLLGMQLAVLAKNI